MISADQFLQADVRMRQAKQQPEKVFGALGLNVCGDFLQLPPVDKDGSRKSLASNAIATALQAEGEAKDAEAEHEDVKPGIDAREGDKKKRRQKAKEDKLSETVQGLHLWRSIRHVVCLQVNVRAPGVLSRLQAEMRAGAISDEMWDLYQKCKMETNDKRLTDPTLPFSKHHWHYIVHRHKLSVSVAGERLGGESQATDTPVHRTSSRRG